MDKFLDSNIVGGILYANAKGKLSMPSALDFAKQIVKAWTTFCENGVVEPDRLPIAGQFNKMYAQAIFGVNPDYGRLQRWIENAINDIVLYARSM